MIETQLHDANRISREGWRMLQKVQRGACREAMPHGSQEEIDAFVAWDEQDRYYESHVNPNSEVGRQFNDSQEFTNPRVAIAYDSQKWPIGFAYAANNVSGATDTERAVKRLVGKNYLWLREVAVAPSYQRQNIAARLGEALLESATVLQPVAAYILPTETPRLQDKLEAYDFEYTGQDETVAFGEGSEPVPIVRMQAASARAVLKRLQA